MTLSEKMRVGIVVECRKIDGRGTDYIWEPESEIPGAATFKDPNKWIPPRAGEGWEHHSFWVEELESHVSPEARDHPRE